MDTAKRKHLRTIGHKLKPVVMIAGRGVTEGVDAELERALEDHELIKIKLAIAEPGDRKLVAEHICNEHKAELVQSIGKIILIFRAARKPNPKLSNLLR
ncbi:MAG TPA: ribosome assembly RNA-binding protein YhbY [Spongiibacteraceae bacterium]|nr:ribosome assembly RNA-binding protein YhbY [Spongiibacteraceae bacterium]MBN51810.1 ribosome assembly RNA-binding protein YhbY [Spongiibacteraceae bacterium]HCS27233.1 ribosome assembly RNA-binding protein YhbY [Spongiibacteraceae bacterium]|tara:strand:- start:1053 stop:1349 length:297 start_codon:yes stop_codon:yes gene_type:complete